MAALVALLLGLPAALTMIASAHFALAFLGGTPSAGPKALGFALLAAAALALIDWLDGHLGLHLMGD